MGIAAQQGKLEEVKDLISRGADPITPAVEGGSTPILKAVYDGHLPTVQYLVGLGAPVNELDSSLGIAPLHAAAMRGHLSVARFLLENGADLNLLTKKGVTSYQLAQQYYNNDIAGLIYKFDEIEHKARTSLLESAKKNLYGQVLKLLEKKDIDINERDDEGNTPLIVAIINGNVPIITALLKGNADQTIINKEGLTALDIAFNKGDDVIANLLLG